MRFNEIIKSLHRRIQFSLVMVTVCFMLLAGASPATSQHTYNGTNYTNAVSKMLVVNSTMQNNLMNGIMRANASKAGFGEFSGASRITPQEIANLCKPFPCGNEGITRTAPPPSAYPSAPVAPPAPRQYPINATDYRPAQGRIIPDEVFRAAQGDAETRELVRNLSNQFLDAFEKEGRKNNVANGFAFLASISIQIAVERELTEFEEQQLILGFNNMLAATPQFASMTARDKQVLTESAVITGGMMAFLHVQGKQNNDAKMQSDARQMAKAAIVYFFGVQIR